MRCLIFGLLVVLSVSSIKAELLTENLPSDTFEQVFSTRKTRNAFGTPTAYATKFALEYDSEVSQIDFFEIERHPMTADHTVGPSFSIRIFDDMGGLPGNAVFDTIWDSPELRGTWTGRALDEGSFWFRLEMIRTFSMSESLLLSADMSYWLEIQNIIDADPLVPFAWETSATGMESVKTTVGPDFIDSWTPGPATGFAFQLYGESLAPLIGDANLDGDVDAWQFDGSGDAQILSSNLGTMVGMSWIDGDFNGDGDVDAWEFSGNGDAQLLSSNLGMGSDMGSVAVPEPSTLDLLGIGILVMLTAYWIGNVVRLVVCNRALRKILDEKQKENERYR